MGSINRIPKRTRLIAIVLAVFVLVSCAGDYTNTIISKSTSVTSTSINSAVSATTTHYYLMVKRCKKGQDPSNSSCSIIQQEVSESAYNRAVEGQSY